MLLEFKTHLEEFSEKDLTAGFWRIWAPIIWPSVIELGRQSCVESYMVLGKLDKLKQNWHSNNLTEYLVATTCEAFGAPPSWRSGLYLPEKVNEFLVLQEMLNKLDDIFDHRLEKMDKLDNIGISIIQFD